METKESRNNEVKRRKRVHRAHVTGVSVLVSRDRPWTPDTMANRRSFSRSRLDKLNSASAPTAPTEEAAGDGSLAPATPLPLVPMMLSMLNAVFTADGVEGVDDTRLTPTPGDVGVEGGVRMAGADRTPVGVTASGFRTLLEAAGWWNGDNWPSADGWWWRWNGGSCCCCCGGGTKPAIPR